MRISTRIRLALLPRYETRVIPWPGWDDDDALPPVWDLDDWRPYGVQVLQGGVRGIVAWRRVPLWERVLRAIRDAISDPPPDPPARDADTPEPGDDVPVRGPGAGDDE